MVHGMADVTVTRIDSAMVIRMDSWKGSFVGVALGERDGTSLGETPVSSQTSVFVSGIYVEPLDPVPVYPGVHPLQVFCPGRSWKVPAGQREQVMNAVPLKDPARQGEQKDASAWLEKLPGRHA